jgi:hypothetical protein
LVAKSTVTTAVMSATENAQAGGGSKI